MCCAKAYWERTGAPDRRSGPRRGRPRIYADEQEARLAGIARDRRRWAIEALAVAESRRSVAPAVPHPVIQAAAPVPYTVPELPSRIAYSLRYGNYGGRPFSDGSGTKARATHPLTMGR